ncbi:hypothetical protein [Dongia sp. agr-C8]
MPGEGRSAEMIRPELEQLRLGLFAVALSILITAVLFAFRVGLPNPPLAILLGPAIVAVAVLPALLWGGSIWAGPLAVVGLLVGCGLAALGTIGFALLWLAAMASAGIAVRRLLDNAFQSPRRVAAWLLLLLAAALLSTLLIAGSKYTNFISDQLLLYGRTDGDVMFHGAIINAYRYFHFPSTGIDGLHLLRYHTGVDVLAAAIAGGAGIDALLGLVILHASVLFPLAVFAVGWGGLLFGQALLPVGLRALAAATAAVIVALLIQCGSWNELSLQGDPMLFSGTLFVLLAPPIVLDLLARRAAAHVALGAAILAVPLLSLSKVSTGAVWCTLIGWLVLRLIGPKRPAFWVTAVAMTILFVGSVLIANDPGQSGAVLFGTPFFVQSGFQAGNHLLPIAVHATLLVVIGALVLLKDVVPEPARRMLIETFLLTALAANVPGLVLEIPGGDAFFFLSALNWLMAPVLAMVVASLPALIPQLQPERRRFAWPLAGLVLLALLVDAGLRADTRFYTAMSGSALVRTGDTTYYADDKRKIWRTDTARALSEHGLFGLFALQPPSPSGASIASALATAKSADAAAYIPPESDYWTYVKDCDGRSLWPMAVAGVPLIDGTVPVQAECRQEFALIGYPAPPEVRTRLDEAALCARADAAGFPVVMEIESLDDRSRDRVAACR